MQFSGDLGNRGRLADIISLCEPRFEPGRHGFQVGNNLLKAHVDLRDAAGARALIEKLYAQRRLDWKQGLEYWEGEIDKLDKPSGPLQPDVRPTIELLLMEAPFWEGEGAPLGGLLPPKPQEMPSVTFMYGSVDKPSEHGDAIVRQNADAIGRLSRGLPALLAEETAIRTSARARLMVPWVQDGGFALAGSPWNAPDLAPHAGSGYLALMHIEASASPWQVRLSLYRIGAEEAMETWSSEADEADPGDAIQWLLAETVRQVVARLGATEVSARELPSGLGLPRSEMLPRYVVALDQALAVGCSQLPSSTLSSERSIFDNLLYMAVEEPANIRLRFQLLQALRYEARRRADIVDEYQARVMRLMREHPLPERFAEVGDKVVRGLFSQPLH